MLKPLHNNVVLKLVKEETTPGGLFIPNDYNTYVKGLVIEVGSEVCSAMNDAKNKVVIFNKFESTEIDDNDQKYYVTKDENILGILE